MAVGGQLAKKAGPLKVWQWAGLAGAGVAYLYWRKKKTASKSGAQAAPYLAPVQSGADLSGFGGGGGASGGGAATGGATGSASGSSSDSTQSSAAPVTTVYKPADYAYGTGGGVAGMGQGFVPTGVNNLGQYVGQSFNLRDLGGTAGNPPLFVAGQSALQPNPVPFYYNSALGSYQSTPVGQYQAGTYVGSHLVTAAEATQLNQAQNALTGAH